MGTKIYNHMIRVRLYQLLIEEIGLFNRENWRTTSADHKPLSYTSKQSDELYARIYSRMIKTFKQEGILKENYPSRVNGLQQQVDWCTTTQNPFNLSIGQFKTQRENRHAAYIAGWMSMTDIVYLEQTAVILTTNKGNN